MKPAVHISDKMATEKDLGGQGTTHELSNEEITLCSQKIPGSHVDSCKEQTNPPDRALKKRRHDRAKECQFDRLPMAILHEILARLSIFELLIARRTCAA